MRPFGTEYFANAKSSWKREKLLTPPTALKPARNQFLPFLTVRYFFENASFLIEGRRS
jgi:hypothetical protein